MILHIKSVCLVNVEILWLVWYQELQRQSHETKVVDQVPVKMATLTQIKQLSLLYLLVVFINLKEFLDHAPQLDDVVERNLLFPTADAHSDSWMDLSRTIVALPVESPPCHEWIVSSAA